MKNILKRISIFFLCIILIFNTCVTTVYASELLDGLTQEELDEMYEKMGLDGPPHLKVDKSIKLLWRWILSQAGAIILLFISISYVIYRFFVIARK